MKISTCTAVRKPISVFASIHRCKKNLLNNAAVSGLQRSEDFWDGRIGSTKFLLFLSCFSLNATIWFGTDTEGITKKEKRKHSTEIIL